MFAWIVYPSKAQRNSINKQVMKDPRIADFDIRQSPFDPRGMLYGGVQAFGASHNADYWDLGCPHRSRRQCSGVVRQQHKQPCTRGRVADSLCGLRGGGAIAKHEATPEGMRTSRTSS